MTVGHMIWTFFSAIALGYTIGMTHWIVMECRRQEKADKDWMEKSKRDIVEEIIERSKMQ